MRLFFLIGILFFINIVSAQRNIKGIVKSSDQHQVLVGATVFFSNTTFKTITNNAGEFELNNLPLGKYDLVITFIGYETFSTTINIAEQVAVLNIELKPRINELQEVIVENFEKDGWYKWGDFFIENFIGTSAFSKQCELKNKEAVRFVNLKKENKIRAKALDPLIIENKALGYIIEFQLEDFEFNFQTRELIYKGYPSFTEMDSDNKRKVERWKKHREEAYEGSMMHFMRAIFRNKVEESGFEIRQIKLVQKPNSNPPIYNEILYTTKISTDSIAYAIDDHTAALFFHDMLQITYVNKKLPNEYIEKFRIDPKLPQSVQTSKIKLRSGTPINIYSNGSFYDLIELISYDFWAWHEKMATMLPFNYKPEKLKF